MQLLAQALAARDGELVMHFPSPRDQASARMAALEVLSLCLFAGCFPTAPREPGAARDAAAGAFVRANGGAEKAIITLMELALRGRIAAPGVAVRPGGAWVAPQLQQPMRELLGSAFFVLALACTDTLPEQLRLLKAADIMGLEDDPRLVRLRAQLLCFEVNRRESANAPPAELSACCDDIVKACDRVLAAVPGDLQAVFTKAFALRNNPEHHRWSEAVRLYEDYLARAEPDDRFRSAAHYHIGLILCMAGNVLGRARPSPYITRGWEGMPVGLAAAARARREYQAGVAAEEGRLPFFQPQGLPSKQAVAVMLANAKAADSAAQASPEAEQRQLEHMARMNEQMVGAAERKAAKLAAHEERARRQQQEAAARRKEEKAAAAAAALQRKKKTKKK